MSGNIKIAVLDQGGTEREFSKGIKVVMKRDIYVAYISLSGEFVCDSAITAAQVCKIRLKLGSSVIFSGIPDRVEVFFQGGVKRISFVSRSYTSLAMQNEHEPGIITDVDLASLVSSCLVHPEITVEQNTPVENYIYVKQSSSLWDAVIAYNIKSRGRMPYIYGTGTIMSTKANSAVRSYSGDTLIGSGFAVSTQNMLSDVHMRIGSDQYQYSYANPLAPAYAIKRSRYYDLDYQWLYDIDGGLEHKVAMSNRMCKANYFEYASFKNEQLYDTVSGSSTACDGMYIDRVVFTADSKGCRTKVYCFDDDYGQI